MRALGLLLAAMVATRIIQPAVPTPQEMLVTAATACFLCLLGIAIPLISWYYVAPRRLRKIHDSMTPSELEIDDEGISEYAPVSQSRHTWDAIRKAREDKNVFLLFLAEHLALVVHKRHLEPFQAEELRTFLRARSFLH